MRFLRKLFVTLGVFIISVIWMGVATSTLPSPCNVLSFVAIPVITSVVIVFVWKGKREASKGRTVRRRRKAQ